MTKISDLGIVSTQGNWRGGISARKMQDEGFVDLSILSEAAVKLDAYFVQEDKKAEARCIDGRCSSTLPEDHMGAQLPGGTPGAALAYRLGLLGDSLEVGNFTDDAHFMLEQSIAFGFVPGDHRDTHGHGVGCGAIDKMDAALAAMLAPELIADHKKIVSALLGESFSSDLYMQVLGAGVVLECRIDEYMTHREKSIEELELQLQHTVSVLEGDHHECFVIVNTVPDSTFATKRFSDDFHGIQAFNYDVWRSFEFANKVFKDEAAVDKFIMARVMTAIATLMVLTDGSQRLLVRSVA